MARCDSAYADLCSYDWTLDAQTKAYHRRQRKASKKLYGRAMNERGINTIGQVMVAYAVALSVATIFIALMA